MEKDSNIADLIKVIVENQGSSEKRFLQAIEQNRVPIARPETVFVDMAMKIGVALCVAGIIYVGSTLQSVQIKTTETSAVLVSVKEAVTDLKNKYDRTSLRQRENFSTSIRPYDQRLQVAEDAIKDNVKTTSEIKNVLGEIKYSVDRLGAK